MPQKQNEKWEAWSSSPIAKCTTAKKFFYSGKIVFDIELEFREIFWSFFHLHSVVWCRLKISCPHLVERFLRHEWQSQTRIAHETQISFHYQQTIIWSLQTTAEKKIVWLFSFFLLSNKLFRSSVTTLTVSRSASRRQFFVSEKKSFSRRI